VSDLMMKKKWIIKHGSNVGEVWVDLPDLNNNYYREVTKGQLAYKNKWFEEKNVPGCKWGSRGKVHLDRVSPTLTTCDVDLIHPERLTYLTVREYARLQGFPDNYEFVTSDNQSFKCIGNSVIPSVAEKIGSKFPKCNVFELFAGAGGMSVGLELAGHDVLYANEWDQYAVENHRHNLPHIKMFHGDIHDIDFLPFNDEINLVTGGSPCQDYSQQGLQKGLAGEKGPLIYQYIRAVKEMEPDYFIFENVVGLTNEKNRDAFTGLKGSLYDLGYVIDYEVVKGPDVGIPQNRPRLFVTGRKRSLAKKDKGRLDFYMR
jgi:site-specific DNA-cytosine methylase